MKRKQLNTLLAIFLLVFFELNLDAQIIEAIGGHLKNDTLIAGIKPASENKLWMGFNAEPQFQDVIQPPSVKHTAPGIITYPPGGAFARGYSLYYQAGRTLGFESGLQYRYSERKSTFDAITFGNGFGSWQNTDDKFHSIELPVLISMRTQGQKFRFYSSIGFAGGVALVARYYVHYQIDVSEPVNSITDIEVFTAFYCALAVRTGIELNVKQNMMLKLGASFNFASRFEQNALENYSSGNVGTLSEGNRYTVFPYSIGLNVALLFKTKTTKGRNRK